VTVEIKCRICMIFNRQWSVGVIGTRAPVCAVLESVIIVSVIVLMLWYVSVSTIVLVPVPELVTM
jgi:hypothetical protein